jgi:hypothetical protein
MTNDYEALQETYKYMLRQFDKQSKRLGRISSDLHEYMGYNDDFLTTESGLNKLPKKELVEVIYQQRAMIRKLLELLPEDIKSKHIVKLDGMYMSEEYMIKTYGK